MENRKDGRVSSPLPPNNLHPLVLNMFCLVVGCSPIDSHIVYGPFLGDLDHLIKRGFNT
jgi:hypothetical protein